ncbi:hypothetical protein JG687_00015456 [Phytophthora cactorum]|uniref:Uncharacterized protein n=1 Tax=Phytophthora cactorum TaxID=29920 RepID=A0A8T1TUX8_9STRA|nr:hypothetical protein JG687_00015456 [Phytophthora cactorum]
MPSFALHLVYADHARVLPTTNVSGIRSLPKIAVYYYQRLLVTEEIGVIRIDILK